MAITRHSNFDKTVQTIADRNLISNKVNGMMVVVLDAIADPNAGSGKAIYRWESSDTSWILVSKSTTETMNFATEELTIVNGEVQLSYIPVDNNVWNGVILNGSLIYADLNLSAVSIANGKITGLTPEVNGMILRITYAYGTISQQITTAIENSVDAALVGNLKSINGQEIVGTGNIVVEGTLPDLKTINGNSIVGTGNIVTASSWTDLSDKPETINGYGIIDAYTKAETEAKIIELAPATDISMKADITYVDTKISDVVGLAPAQLDTLKEIADQLVTDEGAVSALTTTVSNKVDKITGKGLSTEDYTTAEKTKLASLSNYSLPIASSTVLGGVKAGTNISIDANGVISANDTSIAWSEVTGKPTFSTVATSGSYTDLSNKPTIPTVPTTVSSFTNDSGYITSSAIAGKADKTYVDSQDTATLTSAKSYTDSAITNLVNLAPTALDTLGEIATQLANDESAVSALTTVVGNKANSSDVYTKTEIDNKVKNIVSTEFDAGFKRNGKQVYGIEIDCGALINAGSKDTSFTFNSSYTYWVDSQNSYAKSSTEVLPLPYATPFIGEQIGVKLDLTNSKIKLTCGTDRTSYTAKVVLLYTK